MSEVQRIWSHAVDGGARTQPRGSTTARDWQERSEGQNSSELAAQAVATRLMHRRLTREELRIAAPIVHYTFGATVAGAYGVFAERSPRPGWEPQRSWLRRMRRLEGITSCNVPPAP